MSSSSPVLPAAMSVVEMREPGGADVLYLGERPCPNAATMRC